tara:strand:+ start:9697 stop:11115 length:1419 start_codon:yes stop_codon:yes gene_type:complete
MKILFVVPQLDFADHISVAYLSAVAKKLGHETQFLNLGDVYGEGVETSHGGMCGRYFITQGSQTIRKPDVIAYSCTIQGFKKIVEFNKWIGKKTMGWDSISILGGAHATFADSATLLKETGIDFYCVGEGEIAFEKFLKNIQEKIKLSRILPKESLIQDLDSLPFPDRDLTIANSYLKDTPKKTFYTSRGCPYSCSYCANNRYNKMYRGQKIVRRFSVDRVIEEIKYVKSKYRCDFIKFGDDLFALKVDEWLYCFSDFYRKFVSIPFNCYLRVDSVDKTLLLLLKNAGCHSVHLSIDSTREHIREGILNRKSKANTTQMIEKLRLIESYGIKTWVNYMLAAPESTYGDDLLSVYVSTLGKVSYTSYSMTDPIKGTDLYDYCVEKKYIDKSYEGDMSNCSSLSPLNCFTEKSKQRRYNLYLLGAVITRIHWSVYWFLRPLILYLILYIKPNRLFKFIHRAYYKYNIEKVIFKL